jgi:hypothetical protein
MKKIYRKEPPTSKSRKKAEPSASLTMIVDYVFQIALKSILSSVIQHIPKEILKEGSQYINTIYPKLKDQILNMAMKDDTVMKREKVWGHVTNKIIDVLHPLIQATNIEQKPLIQVPIKSELDDPMNDIIPVGSSTLNHAIKVYAQSHSAEKKSDMQDTSQLIPIYWPKPLEINFLQIKDADDVATISCKVGGGTIPYAMIDSGSDSSIISENIAKHLGLKIDRKKVHRLNGVASKSHSLGTVDSVPVTIEDGKNRDTIPDEFSVVPTEYDDNGKELSLFILGTQWQYRAGWEPLVKGKFRVSRNGKTITILLSVHKSQCNVFTIGKEPESIKKKI